MNSSFVEFTSSGFYFNEIEGIISNAPLSLSALSDVRDKSSINVNVLTHLEKKRVETLIRNGKSFSESKAQSRNEILSIFSVNLNRTTDFEDFDISKNNEEGGILLAISVILQQGRSVGQLTELLSKIQNDVSGDGKLNNDTILSSLRTRTVNLDLVKIRKNVETRYKELNLTTPIPSFENYIINFSELKNLKISIEGKGIVTEKIVSNLSGKSYPKGMIVELTAIPEKGWAFEGWGGDISGNETPKKVTIDSEKNIITKFKRKYYPITITLIGEGSVIKSPDSIVYPFERIVELKAVPKSGWVFESWGGNLSGTVNPQTIMVDTVKNVIVRFRQPIFRLADNGVTCKCENVKVGEKGSINGVEYEVVDNTLIRQRRDEGADMTKLCTSLVTDMYGLFNNKSFNQPIGNWDVSNVSTMHGMFSDTPFNQSIENWDVSKVTNMNYMFFRSPFNQPVGNWNVSIVTNMESMFFQTPFNQPIGNWNVSNVRNMFYMFGESKFNQSIGNWNVSNVSTMRLMFAKSPFNQDIQNWDVSNVAEMNEMFRDTPFNQLISNWNVSNVTDMHYMFFNTPFNQPIGNWDVSSVTDMESMLASTPFNQDIGNWNVRSVRSMIGMFANTPFNRDISTWDVSSVRNTRLMFYRSSFNQPIGNWNVSSVSYMLEMFKESSFNQPLGNWNVSNTIDMRGMFAQSPFNQDITKWCVTNFVTEPEGFSTNLIQENKPVWGTCPN